MGAEAWGQRQGGRGKGAEALFGKSSKSGEIQEKMRKPFKFECIFREIQPGHIRQKDANPSNLMVFVDKSIKFGHIGGFSAACAERRRPPPGALALPIEVLKAEAGGRGQRAEAGGPTHRRSRSPQDPAVAS